MLVDRNINYGNDALRCALVAALGPDTPRVLGPICGSIGPMRWRDLFRLGVNPALVRAQSGFEVQFPASGKDSGIEHPLNVAANYLIHDHGHDALRVLEEYDTMLSVYEEHIKNKSSRKRGVSTRAPNNPFGHHFFSQNYWSSNVWCHSWVNPVDPRQYGIEPRPFHPLFDYASHLLWFDDEGASKVVSNVSSAFQVQRVFRIVEITGQVSWRGKVERLAAKQARDSIKKKGVKANYADIVQMLRLSAPGDARRILDDITKGAKKSVKAARRDCTSEQMVEALRAISKAGEDPQRVLLSRLGRAPTADEVKAVKSKHVVSVLYLMPWVLLEQTLSTGSLRGFLLRFSGEVDLEVLQDCLIDHPKRLDHLPDVSEAAPAQSVANGTHDGEWGTVFTREWGMHAFFKKARQDLHDASQGVWELSLAALLPALRVDHADNVLSLAKDDPLWPAVKAAVKNAPDWGGYGYGIY